MLSIPDAGTNDSISQGDSPGDTREIESLEIQGKSPDRWSGRQVIKDNAEKEHQVR
jgi:hypothetical protein